VYIDPPTLRRLCRARELLDELLPVRTVAREVGISPYHFIRQFDAVFGETPHRYRTRQRIERAKLLLARGTSVTDVCMEVGFSSVGSFSALFTRWAGVAPSQFRGTEAELHAGCLTLFRNFEEAPPAAVGQAATP
jgi:AraC-like DNA-binding protein